MADNGSPKPQFLAPPAVTALRQEARNINPKMTRSLSENIKEERDDLKEAAEQTLNIIVDLDLEGRVKWSVLRGAKWWDRPQSQWRAV